MPENIFIIDQEFLSIAMGLLDSDRVELRFLKIIFWVVIETDGVIFIWGFFRHLELAVSSLNFSGIESVDVVLCLVHWSSKLTCVVVVRNVMRRLGSDRLAVAAHIIVAA